MKRIFLKALFMIILVTIVGCGGIKGVKIPENYEKALPQNVSIEMPNIPQWDGYSCATTSLAMVMSYYDDKRYNKSDVWDRSGSSIDDVKNKCGNDMNGLKRAAASYGFKNYEFVTNLDLDEIKFLLTKKIPVIVNIRNFFQSSYHAVVIYGYDENGFMINDPNGARYNIDYEMFLDHWYAHLCSPTRGRYYRSAFILYN